MGPVADRVEIGGRLARDCWGAGFASEAARSPAAWTFENLPDDEIRAITWRGNVLSRAVLERLGMHDRPELGLGHSKLAEQDTLRAPVTHSLTKLTRISTCLVLSDRMCILDI